MKALFFKKKKKKNFIKLKHSFSKAIIKTKSNSTFKSNKGPKKLSESIKKLKIQMPCKCFTQTQNLQTLQKKSLLARIICPRKNSNIVAKGY